MTQQEAEAKSSKERQISLIILANFIIFFLICFGCHWASSRVYRAQLPDFADLQLSFQELQIPESSRITLSLAVLSSSGQRHCDQVKEKLQLLFHQKKGELQYDVVCLESDLPPNFWSNLEAARSPSETDSLLQTIQQKEAPDPYALQLFVIHSHSLDSASGNEESNDLERWYVGRFQHAWLRTAASTISDKVLRRCVAMLTAIFPNKDPDLPHKPDLTKLPVWSSYTFSFSLLSEEPAGKDVPATAWDFHTHYTRWLEPFVAKLAPVCDVYIDSQLAHFGSLSSHYQYEAAAGRWVLPVSSLRDFVSRTQWNVGSPLRNHSIEFVAYAPAPRHTPLFISESDKEGSVSTSFIIPRWGVVTIVNNYTSTNSKLDDLAMQSVMEMWLGELRLMLGLHAHTVKDSKFTLLPSPTGLAEWELSLLMSSRLRQTLLKVQDTLISFYELLERVPHMPVSDHIKDDVSNAIQEYKNAVVGWREARWSDAMVSARLALVSADAAFFDKSMLPLLYFPNEHLYAVYAPFFVPVVVPVVGAIVKRFKKK